MILDRTTAPSRGEGRRRTTSVTATLAAVAAAAAALAVSALPAQAQFVQVPGSATGRIELASYDLLYNPAGAAILNGAPGPNGGQTLQVGGNYPRLNGLHAPQPNYVNTGVQNLNMAAVRGADGGAAGPNANFGGGGGNLFTVQGGAAGIVSNNFFVADRGTNGVAAALTMGAQGSWVNTGPGGFFTGGIFLGMTAHADPLNPLSFVEAGIGANITITPLVGAPTVFTPLPIFMGYNPGGGISPVSFIQADQFVFLNNPAAGTLTFKAVSRVNLFIPAGATVTVAGTATFFGDPMDITFTDFPTDGTLGPMPDLGSGSSANAFTVPEASTLPLTMAGAALPLLGGLIVRRRQRSRARS